jgi:hypothetical protein
MRQTSVTRLLFSSTAAVYGDRARQPIEESDSTLPTNPYGAAKLAFEQALPWYGNAYGLVSISLRYFNAAGATSARGERHDPETHLIPLVLAHAHVLALDALARQACRALMTSGAEATATRCARSWRQPNGSPGSRWPAGLSTRPGSGCSAENARINTWGPVWPSEMGPARAETSKPCCPSAVYYGNHDAQMDVAGNERFPASLCELALCSQPVLDVATVFPTAFFETPVRTQCQ